MSLTNFRTWKEAVGVVLVREYDIEPSRVPMRVLNSLYISGTEPVEAAACAAAEYLNGMPHADRLRFLMTRNGRVLSAADERMIRRQVKRKGRR